MTLFEAQNSQSPSSIMHEVLKDTGDRTFKSPKEFMLPLKSGPRPGRRKPRKLGKSMIATDTPEKNQIAEERKKHETRSLRQVQLNDLYCKKKNSKNQGKRRKQRRL
ncbi:unnamed protein product [Parnassius apollo]|uniref:(apollo) hypothetical protein n=1 Tax=Parnassius apollo TaxID=110799 RepID=A0A8S3XYQ8_PARAO|nr:unnamed protein product [Parnassius apollo]